jgi:hypothetical protein
MYNYSPVPVLDAVSAVLPFARMLSDSLLAAMYYTGFVRGKFKSNKLTFAAFGGAFFAFQFVLRIVYDSTESPSPFVRMVLLMCAVFVLALIFFKANIKLHTFLLISFFAVRELSFVISYSIRNLLKLPHTRGGNTHSPVHFDTFHIFA